MVDVRAAMWLRTTGGDDEMKGRSCRSPTPYPSNPSSSARTAFSTTSRKRSVVDMWIPVMGSGTCVMSVMARNFIRDLPCKACQGYHYITLPLLASFSKRRHQPMEVAAAQGRRAILSLIPADECSL